MMQVSNEWFYEDLTPDNTKELLDNMAKGDGFTPGPQIPNRVNSEGPEGRTTLHPDSLKNINYIHNRDFGAAKKAWEEEKAAAAAAAKK